MISRLESHAGVEDLASKIIYKRSYCVSDFIHDYNAFGGNAYGLANTLSQTAVLKPKIKKQESPELILHRSVDSSRSRCSSIYYFWKYCSKRS
ncbi:hypothetical protein [Sphingobacterium daejeonense]|uniref:hypothetical protein n=1 Tax=Sphingobacterium daejeonense TaxID=371142 RepID=UPI0010C57BA1|nr:hypothetical protein [Sphingobacterium daejeonense]VTP95632.1 phytoene desaturase [Sphingobacterium daejeonense]